MPLITNIKGLYAKARATKIGKMGATVSKKTVRPLGRMINKYPKTSAAIGVGAGTGFYLYNGKRNAYEEEPIE